MTNQRSTLILLAVCTVLCAPDTVLSQGMDPTIRPELISKVTDHVHYIPDEHRPLVPNVGFVVGTRAILVIDTGLGEENGAIVLEAARSLTATERFFVVSTHTHPEHDLGVIAFPPDATVIRSTRQEEDIAASGMSLANRFAQFSERTAELLEGASVRPSDIVFEDKLVLDLGGVTVQLLNAGPAHTRGDLAIYVEEDEVLFTGDVVMNQFPNPMAPNGTTEAWLAILDAFEALDPQWVIPCHYDIGGVELIQNYRRFFTTLRERAAGLHDVETPIDAISDQLSSDVPPLFEGWSDSGRIGASIRLVLREFVEPQ